jgi:hypothetical protein
MGSAKAVEDLRRRIGRAVVDEDEGPVGTLVDRGRESTKVEAVRLIEAGNDDGYGSDGAGVSQAT